MLVVSTSHVSEETAKMINRLRSTSWSSRSNDITWAPTFSRDEGWMWYVGEENPVVLDMGWPDEFAALFSLAMKHGCNWLMLDRDGDVVDDLPTFEW
jgi:hypothetical protein